MLNQTIINKVKKIPDGVLYLLALHHQLDTSVIPHKIKREINNIGIFDYNGTKLIWKTGLYEPVGLYTNIDKNGFSWVHDWAKKFKEINQERVPDYNACKARMINLFKTYGNLNKDIVYKARDLYFDLLSEPKYLKKPHKFILEGTGNSRTSDLMTYVNMYIEQQSTIKVKVDKSKYNEF